MNYGGNLGEQVSFRIADTSEGVAKRLGERIALLETVENELSRFPDRCCILLPSRSCPPGSNGDQKLRRRKSRVLLSTSARSWPGMPPWTPISTENRLHRRAQLPQSKRHVRVEVVVHFEAGVHAKDKRLRLEPSLGNTPSLFPARSQGLTRQI